MDIDTYFIKTFCRIKDDKITVDGNTAFENYGSFADFSKQAFRHLKIAYPKFFKMDHLSRLAFLASELILSEYPNKQTALLFSNKSSSLDTDVNYQASIADRANYFPSPGVFVYTLPNICLGEISIRHQLKTENSFFIFDRFNPEFLAAYATLLLDSGSAENVLCGWVELYNETYDALVYLVGKEGSLKHSAQQLEILYNS